MSNSNNGRLIVVVGPSGAGKDSIIKAAQKHFSSNSRVKFVRRVITRECDPASEVHDSVSESQFLEKQAAGDFAVWWQANGLHYGLPSSVQEGVANGQLMIANGSRAAIPDIRSKFPQQLIVVLITATIEVLSQRLENRSRETAADITKRLQRNQTIAPLSGSDVMTIDNSGERPVAIQQFIAFIDSLN